jgi:hypothetical protein
MNPDLSKIHEILNEAGLAAELHGDTFHIDADPHDLEKALHALEHAGAMVAKNGKEYRIELDGELASLKEV